MPIETIGGMMQVTTLNIALGLFFLSVGLWCLIFLFEPLKNWLKVDVWPNGDIDEGGFFGAIAMLLSMLSVASGVIVVAELGLI